MESERATQDRYVLAMLAFDEGRYEQSAAMLAALVLRVPQDPSGDALRHLLVQHIGWALLGSHDIGQDAGVEPALDRGEQMLETYLVTHEALLPDAAGEREAIYALLAEYSLRREGEPPPPANERLRALVTTTSSHLLRATSTDHDRHANEDPMVREIEVDARGVPWGTQDHPRIQAFFRDTRDLGPSLYNQRGEPFHPTRVLVRGIVGGHPPGAGAGKRTRAILATARPALERCYEHALGRGADLVERVNVDLAWGSGALDSIELDANQDTGFDGLASICVREALRAADQAQPAKRAIASAADADLRLTFFVQAQGIGVHPDDFEYTQAPTAFSQMRETFGR